MGCLPFLMVLALLALGAQSKVIPSPASAEGCHPDKMTVYKMVMHTFWTRDKFPKHYPDWRPPAQWGKVYGRSHDKQFVLFRLGERVASSVKMLAEGRTPSMNSNDGGILMGEASAPGEQGTRGVLDAFVAPNVPQGAGRTEAEFFVDGNHSKISLMSRMVPSPDWFVGIDSFDLCVNGNWLDSITVEVDPIDAGTDNGFTFTAPNWPTEPQGVAYRMTSRYPSHPAGSFYYPHVKRLPPIATFQFLKLKEYELSEVFHHASDDKSYEVLKMEQPSGNSIDVLDGSSNALLSLAIEEERAERDPHPSGLAPLPPRIISREGLSMATPGNMYTISPFGANTTTVEPREANELPRGDKTAILNSIARTYRNRSKQNPSKTGHKKHAHRKSRASRDCRVSNWGAWSSCSRTCGIGETRRTRRIVRPARRNGRECPPLTETRWCGSARDCPKEYFNW